ncbi:MAG: trimethylamine methyltransferase family protein [Deltaproteobacteria bacterium]|nr:trimethylamine methyltransferase family protein [Deltaproteobacteria bacterium]MBW2121330.1 trimethylamine methyltransferase family protein [Deltaproteobacteria bacterium]
MDSETPEIVPFVSALKKELLTQSQVETLRGGTLRLLEEVGVHFPSRTALELFSDHGALVDMDRQIVRIPPGLVTKAMSTAPRSFVLAGRHERFDLVLDGSRSYLCTDGCGVHVVDLWTRKQRPSRKDDVARMARVCDALPMISFFWPMVSAQDHGRTAPLHECHAGLVNTLKHVRGGTTVFAPLARYIVEMATVVAGSGVELRRRPPINANICTIAPLAQDADGIESALVYAEAGIPVSFMAMTTMGSTAPATPLGALVTGDAEVVSAMVLIQLAYPGAPVFHSVLVSLMDPRTGDYVSEVPLPVNMISVQLAHAWGVPSLGGGGVSSDALDIGWQSGMEAGMGAALIPLCGGEICGYLGLLGGSMVLYPEQVILDHEVCRAAYDLFRGFEFEGYDMALDVIEKVGPRGHFLMEDHTCDHVRDFRLSRLLGRKDGQGRLLDPRTLALEEFKRIDENHHPEPLPREVLAELDRILAAADREAQRMA